VVLTCRAKRDTVAPFRSRIDYSVRPVERTSMPGCIRQATGSRVRSARRRI